MLDRFALDGPVVELLRAALEVGVPLRMAQYQRDARSTDWLAARAQWASGIIAGRGDALLFRTRARTVAGQRLPGTAEVCNALIEGVAAAALTAPGGISVFGLTFRPPAHPGGPCTVTGPDYGAGCDPKEPGR